MKRSPMPARKTPLRPAVPSRWWCPDCGVECFTDRCDTCEGTAERVVTARPVQPKVWRPKRTREYREVHAAVLDRAGGRCERCLLALACQAHHRVTRARGGPDHPDNLAALCAVCHAAVHAGNEEPWLLPGRFAAGVYVGPWEPFVERFGRRGAA